MAKKKKQKISIGCYPIDFETEGNTFIFTAKKCQFVVIAKNKTMNITVTSNENTWKVKLSGKDVTGQIYKFAFETIKQTKKQAIGLSFDLMAIYDFIVNYKKLYKE